MIGEKPGRDRADAMFVRLMLLLLLLPVVVLGTAWATMSAGLPDPVPAVVTGVVALLHLVVVTVFVIRRALRMGRLLDGVFEAHGMAFSGRMGAACRYSGAIDGRAATASVSVPFRVQPWRIEATVAADLAGTRIALGSTRPLLDCRGAPRVDCGDPGLAGIHIHAGDADAARRVLSTPAVLDALRPMIGEWRGVSSWELYIQPRQLWLRLRTYRLDDAATGRWLGGLGALAGACERDRRGGAE